MNRLTKYRRYYVCGTVGNYWVEDMDDNIIAEDFDTSTQAVEYIDNMLDDELGDNCEDC